MEKELAIKVENLSKTFRIPHEKITTIRGAFVNAFHSKGYEEFNALDDISFEVKKGEFFGIIGRNGSGKSTLLKILAGVYKADKGKVHVDGLISPFLELGIGFQPELSGRDNIYLNATVLGLMKKQIDEKFDEIVDFSELRRFIDQKIKNYSSGMQVRLAFSVAVHANRDILLMDEVLAVGDVNFQGKCLEEFNKYRGQGKTVILVTHDIETVSQYCDRAMLLQEGKVISLGNPSMVTGEYRHSNQQLEAKRLFAENKESEKTETPAQEERKLSFGDSTFRMGSKQAEIIEYKIFDHNNEETLSLKSGERFKIVLKVRFNDDVRKPMFGFMFQDRPGGIFFGIHSDYSRKPLGIEMTKKETILEVSCDGEMVLIPRVYHLSLACVSMKYYPHYEDLDIMSNMIKVNVYSDRILWGSINSDAIVTAKEVETS